MNKEFIPYEQAMALKELGFNEPCLAIYYSKDKSFSWHHHKDHTNDEPALESGEFNISAPLYQQAFRWFREKHWLYPSVISHDVDNHIFTITGGKLYESDDEQDNFDSYKEAELACLVKLIEICKTKTNEQAD